MQVGGENGKNFCVFLRFLYPLICLSLEKLLCPCLMKYTTLILLSLFALNCPAQNIDIEDVFSELTFYNVGPTRGGRVTTVAGIESQPSDYYMGASGGGVWKTTNYGRSWQNVSDGYFSTGSIGAIRVFQDNPDIVYVGTGSDGIRSNVIIGKGMYRTDDAGQSWDFIGLKNAGQIGAVEIHPDDPDICYVAAIGNPFGPNPMRGVFKTENGGDDWNRVLFISDNTGAVDLEICPDNSDIIYASAWTVRRKPWTIISGSEEGGIYKSINGGESWEKLTNGLPSGIIGKSDLAICKSKPENLYVLMEAEDSQNGLYFSDNYGESFSLLSDYSSLLDRPFYYCNLDVDPNNPDVIFVNTTGFHKSTDKGKSWNRVSTPHGDNHDMWINPSNSDLFIQSNDGGANITRDGGKSWSPQNNQPTAELYQVNLDDQFPYWLYAGQQDNSTLAIPSNSSLYPRRGGNSIMSVGGCETGPAVPKPGNHNIVYSNCKGRFGTYNKITGTERQYYVGAANLYGHNPRDLKYRFQRVSPIIVSPHNADVVYHASQFLHKTTDDGVSWETISPDLTAFEDDKQVISGSPITRDITGEEFYSTIYSINESPITEGLIWVGANDGPVHVTRNGGSTWDNVTPEGLPPGGRVQTIELSVHNSAKAYIAVYRFLLNDWQPYIYKTTDFGKSWQRISTGDNGIPNDFPTRVIREDPDREGLLYAGTEFGLFISFNDGISWSKFQNNLPIVPITDIKVYRNDLILSTMGRSFWIMRNISPLHDSQFIGEKSGVTLFKPAIAYRSRVTDGADIDYYLPSDVKDINLQIKDLTGKIISNLNPSSEKGFHRVGWGLYSGNTEQNSGRRRSYGPKVVPGQYIACLETNGIKIEETFTVLPDPRIVDEGMTQNDFQEQYDLCVKVQELQSKGRKFQKEVDSLLETHNNKAEGKRQRAKVRQKLQVLSELRSELVTDKGPYPQPMLLSQISYLYSMISRADQKPGRDAYIRYDELKNQLEILNETLKEM